LVATKLSRNFSPLIARLSMPFRADRVATLYFFHPLRLIESRPSKIPVLMYHSISEPANTALHPYLETATAPRVFAEQMRLYENNYQTVSLSGVALKAPGNENSGHNGNAVAGNGKTHGTKSVPCLPLESGSEAIQNRKSKIENRYVVITFDDGFQDFCSQAFGCAVDSFAFPYAFPAAN
jgi:hypothetical protein